MNLQPVLIGGDWRPSRAPTGSFQPVNPATRATLGAAYPVSSMAELEQALAAAQDAAVALRDVLPERLADFLEGYAGAIEARAGELVAMAHQETALAIEPRLRLVELPRTTDQLRQAAAAARDRSWRLATIDSQRNIRSYYGPLGGAIVIFGPNNFPFAFNAIAGGDFAAAIAAGNPVIAKAHPGHPGTTRILAAAAHEALQQSGLPPGLVQMFYHTEPENGLRLVAHPLVGAVAFTGSRPAGLRLKEAADKAGKPIYLEMSSINPVFILPGALEERLEAIADEFIGSCTLAAGQFCTNPGLVILMQDERSEAFVAAVVARLERSAAGVLFSEAGPRHLTEAIATWQRHGAEVLLGGYALDGDGYGFANTLARVTDERFLANAKALQSEAFGTASLLVLARDGARMAAVAGALAGNLTASIYSGRRGQDDALYDTLAPVLRPKVGRLLNDKMPTGVAVSPAMVHGGPFPATGHPGFTAVGIPASLRRFAALYGYDNVRPERLPVELQDPNPTGQMWRFIDGEWTQEAI